MGKRFVFAINNKDAQVAIESKIKTMEESFVIDSNFTAQADLLEYFRLNKADVCLLSEDLAGELSGEELVCAIKHYLPGIRIIYLSSSDTKNLYSLARLVSYGVWDILAGEQISINEIVTRILTPSTWEDASVYIPEKELELFKETEFVYSQEESAQKPRKTGAHKFTDSDLDKSALPEHKHKTHLKFVLAIDDRHMEQHLKSSLEGISEYLHFAGVVNNQQSVLDFEQTQKIHILVIAQGLKGKLPELEFLKKVRNTQPGVRVVYITGPDTNNKSFYANLLALGILDFVVGEYICVTNIAQKVVAPTKYVDVLKYLPSSKHIESKALVAGEGDVETVPEKEIVSQPTTDKEENAPKKGLSLLDMFKQKPEKKSAVVITQETGSFSALNAKNEEQLAKYKSFQEKLKEAERELAQAKKEKEKIKKDYENTLKEKAGIEKENKSILAQKEKLNKEKEFFSQQNKDLSKKYEKIKKEWEELDRNRRVISKQRVIVFWGAMPGVGTSTCALNAATYLALKGNKVVYIEYNLVSPRLSYYYDLSEAKNCLESAVLAIETRNIKDMSKSIYSKEKILGLNSELRTSHQKLPEKLDYLFFSDAYIEEKAYATISASTVKDLILHLMYKDGYDYVILDLASSTNFAIVQNSCIFSSTNVFCMTQDIATIGYNLKSFKGLNTSGVSFEFITGIDKSSTDTQSYKNIYLVNKYSEKNNMTKRKISDWLMSRNVYIVPENTHEIQNYALKGYPATLVSKNKDYLMSVKGLCDNFR